MEGQLSDEYTGDIIKVEPAEVHDVQDGEPRRFDYTAEEVRPLLPSERVHVSQPSDDDGADSSQMQQMFLINRGTLQELYSLDMDPKRKEFLDHYLEFMKQRGTPLSRVPSVGRQMLDLYKLFVIVRNLGGVHEVIQNRRWNTVRKFLGIPATLTSAAYTLKARYLKLLYAYDCSQRGCVIDKSLANFDFQAIKGERTTGREEQRYHGDDRQSSFHLAMQHSSTFQHHSPLNHSGSGLAMTPLPPRLEDLRDTEAEEGTPSGHMDGDQSSPPSRMSIDIPGRVLHQEVQSPSSSDLLRCSMVDPKSVKSQSESSQQNGNDSGADTPSQSMLNSNGGRGIVSPEEDAERDRVLPESNRQLEGRPTTSSSPPTASGDLNLSHYRHAIPTSDSRVAVKANLRETGAPHGTELQRDIRPSRLESQLLGKSQGEHRFNSEQVHLARSAEHSHVITNRNATACCDTVHGSHGHSPTHNTRPYGYRPGASRVMYEHHPQMSSGQKRYYPVSDASPTPVKRRPNHAEESPVWESTCLVGFKIHRKYDNKLILTVDVNGESFSGTLTKTI